MTLDNNIEVEKDIQRNVFSYVDRFESFIFDSGAGSGKTFALVETIKYVLEHKSGLLENFSQNVVCITYTNVAVDEIKDRLGNSNIAIVSTIHEFVWQVISIYQRELVKIHREFLIEKIGFIEKELADEEHDDFGKYAGLEKSDQELFSEFSIESKKIFYQSKRDSASELRCRYRESDIDKPEFLDELLKNVQKFRKLTSCILRLDAYKKCLSRIDHGLEGKVKYDNSSNRDRLGYMKISHDTLLEYGYRMFDKFPRLNKVVIDKFPYFFIDEFQDTNEKVVLIIKKIYDFAAESRKKWMVGYFGDIAQNIYDDGVGRDIEQLHPELKHIRKYINRRSHDQIVDLINKVRGDDLKQVPIDPERSSGSVGLFNAAVSDLDEVVESVYRFIDYCRDDLGKGENGKIHCLVLTNKLMSRFNGFFDVYQAVEKSKAIDWDQLKTELLSNDLSKLHPAIVQIYNIVNFKRLLLDESTTFDEFMRDSSCGVSFSEALLVLRAFDFDGVNSLASLVDRISDVSEDFKSSAVLKELFCFKLSVDYDDFECMDSYAAYFLDNIYDLFFGHSASSDLERMSNLERLHDILNVDLVQWEKWLYFIKGQEDGDVIFHTYHGTKGAQYDDVVIIMEHDFGAQGKGKFKEFFQFNQLDDEQKKIKLQDEIYRSRFENTRNLVYVACSRAVRNLRVLYLGDLEAISSGLESMFGIINNFPKKKRHAPNQAP